MADTFKDGFVQVCQNGFDQLDIATQQYQGDLKALE
jgi:hypothetical protein